MNHLNDVFDEIEKYLVDINLRLNYEFNSELANKQMSKNQQLILYLIGVNGINHVKDLAYYMNLSASAISQMITKMEQMHLVTREIDTTNRRSTILKLGSEGEALLEELQDKRRKIAAKYLTKMDEKHLVNIRDALKHVNDIIYKAQEEDSK
ncbi:winged helix DNA-binding protein [Salipaludibacillus agaradhaerens]|uniref:MarR family winged helix-turn-helix transcriptional regulator n=1 Tax=Salipaludibacillus agaradhaerens TaxID=76935 RepID=UPI0021515174|nr:MarR family transcriptional regulator [Salipaludibacillus agaradhaerens]MCR6107405.1 winged helix DNA-binding protein [Salipaludibacillus agaradhaerens]MCR6119434.1 winged helix DNA-binding protein [Salipaludibacillus agaradhaerens]